jgi:hypothetical protein
VLELLNTIAAGQFGPVHALALQTAPIWPLGRNTLKSRSGSLIRPRRSRIRIPSVRIPNLRYPRSARSCQNRSFVYCRKQLAELQLGRRAELSIAYIGAPSRALTQSSAQQMSFWRCTAAATMPNGSRLQFRSLLLRLQAGAKNLGQNIIQIYYAA